MVEIYKSTTQANSGFGAGKIYLQNIIDAFNGETVVAYKVDNEFTDILPQIQICKKTDYRYGKDENSDTKNRNKYLKHTYKQLLN